MFVCVHSVCLSCVRACVSIVCVCACACNACVCVYRMGVHTSCVCL